MTDYIKREDALKAVNGIHEDDLPRNNKIEVCDVLTLVPSADVAPVVRCKDCKCCHRFANDSNSNMKSWCLKFSLSKRVNGDDFCAWGERRDDEL